MPELNLGKSRARAQGERYVVRINAEDADDGKDHAWPLPRTLTQASLKKIAKLVRIHQGIGATPGAEASPEQVQEVVELLDDVFSFLFGSNAEDAANFLGPEDIESIMQFYGVKLGELSASLAS